jgi:hypothetical protein
MGVASIRQNGDAIEQVILQLAFVFQINRTYKTYLDVFDVFFDIIQKNDVHLTFMHYCTDHEQGPSLFFILIVKN